MGEATSRRKRDDGQETTETGGQFRRGGSDDPWTGVVYVAVGALSIQIFTSGGGPADATGVVASVLIVLYGLSTAWVSAFSNPLADASDAWTGCFWLLVGLGVVGFVLAFRVSRVASGLMIGIGTALYGVSVVLES